MNRILITGGAGFTGSHLVEELLSNEHEILIFVGEKMKNKRTGMREDPPELLENSFKSSILIAPSQIEYCE